MKLAEALLERKELSKKISRLEEEVSSIIVTTDSDTYSEEAIESKLDEINILNSKLEALNISINKANAHHQAENLVGLQQTDRLIAFYQKLRNKLLNPREERGIWAGEGPKYNKNYSLQIINGQLERLEKMRTQIDRKIMKTNWQIEI